MFDPSNLESLASSIYNFAYVLEILRLITLISSDSHAWIVLYFVKVFLLNFFKQGHISMPDLLLLLPYFLCADIKTQIIFW